MTYQEEADAEREWFEALQRTDAERIAREEKWMAKQTAAGKGPWTDPEYCAAWMAAYREDPQRDYKTWHHQHVASEEKWVAKQTAKGKAPWTDPEYCAAWLDAYRENPRRDYDTWHRERTAAR